MIDQEVNKQNFQFLSNLHSKHLNCKICSLLMFEPMRLHSCGHTFCKLCVGDQKIKACPICTTKIQFKQKDILASKLVGELPVRCLSIGCPWEGAFEQYSNFHQQSCKLKNGGIDEWLKELQNTISENTSIFGNKLQQKPKSQEPKMTHDENLHEIPQKNQNDQLDEHEQKDKQNIIPSSSQKKDQTDLISTKQSSKSKNNRKSKKQTQQEIIKPKLRPFQ